MPAQQPPKPADSPISAGFLIRAGAVVAFVSAGFFALSLGDDPFVDEYAYITQSYQGDLVFAGRMNDPSWLNGVCYDLVPLPKYLINLAFRAAAVPRPAPRDAFAWYHNINYRWGSQKELMIARLPSIVVAALGCAAIFALGTLAEGPWAGAVASLLLAVNPLFHLHAHRAMSEASCETFLLLALALGLWAWKQMLLSPPRTALIVLLLGAGISAGLSLLAKFNGVLAILALGGWMVLGLLLVRPVRNRQLALGLGFAVASLTAIGTFVLLNPFMTAHPPGLQPVATQAIADLGIGERFRFLIDHRREVSRRQQETFPHNAVLTLTERARVVAVQGFGRFGPLGPRKSDSTIRYDLNQDWGALVWLPMVAAGLAWSVVLGKHQRQSGKPPTAWAIAIWACLALAAVVGYLPMAWDRYELPIQAPATLLVAIALGSTCQAIRRWLPHPATRA